MSEREGSQRERGARRTGGPALAPGDLSEERTLRRQVTEVEVGERIEAMRRRRPRFVDERITTAHGAGGKASRALVEGVIVPLLENDALAPLGDAALLEVGGARLALTTDAFVVRPIRFPGGSIGELAVNGTVNDLAVTGARPLALSVALVLEEGLPADVLRAEVTPWRRPPAPPACRW